jgi:hypothetical protein
MTYPSKNPNARICILRYPDETMVCANIEGFRAIGEWITWLATSDPVESFHFHLLWHLESDESRFEGIRPGNVWFLSQSQAPVIPQMASASNAKARIFELTFQVVSESTLDELAEYQDSGVIPERFEKHEASIIVDCE